jgi:hypothetical protein
MRDVKVPREVLCHFKSRFRCKWRQRPRQTKLQYQYDRWHSHFVASSKYRMLRFGTGVGGVGFRDAVMPRSARRCWVLMDRKRTMG